MKCRHCDKDMVKALELFNGDLRCPHCGASIVPGEGEVDVNADNDELYRLSRANFFTYLEKASGYTSSTTKKEIAEAEGFLDRAVEFCEKAAAALHPEAIADLGYYYCKNYVNADVVGVGRYKTAYSYFRCILDVKNYDDIKERYQAYYNDIGSMKSAEDEASRVVTKAAYYMLDMISTAPEELTEQTEYSLVKVKELIGSNPNIKLGDMGTFLDKTALDEAIEKVQRIQKALESCRERSSSHSPLFGYFEITPAEYPAVKSIAAKYTKGIVFEILFEQGGALEWGGIGNPDTERTIASDPSLKMYFCFFNETSSSKVYKKGFKVSSVEDELMDRNSKEGLPDLVKTAGRKEQIFYWDDGYFVVNNKSKFKREAGRDYSVTTGFIMLSSGEYEAAWEK